jgi:c-di-GMP-binding flagellar brake protein YcgR
MGFDDKQLQANSPQMRPVRRYPRYVFSVPITIRHWPPHGFRTTRGMTLDISAGGMAAIMPGNFSVGETVEIDLALPAGLLNTVARVKYKAESRCGFEFLGLSSQEQEQIMLSVHQC